MAPTPEEMQRRLDELAKETDSVRERAERDGLLPEEDPAEREPTLADPDPGRPGDEGIPGEATG